MPKKIKKKYTTISKSSTQDYKDRTTGPEGAAERAAKALDVPPPVFEPMPFESSLAFAFRAVGGKKTAVEGARLLANDDVRFSKLIYAWEHMTERDQEKIRLEDLCAAVEITPELFLSLVVPVLWKRNVDIGKLISGMAIAPVVEAVAARAQGQFGMPDAKMILDMHGMLPTNKGTQISIDNSKKTLNIGKGVDISASPGLPTFEESIQKTTQAIRGDASVSQVGRQKQLEAAPIQITQDILEAEVIDVPSENDPGQG